MLSNKRQRIPKGQSKKGQSREIGNTMTHKKNKTNKKHNTILCVGNHYTQTNTTNAKKDMCLPTNNWR